MPRQCTVWLPSMVVKLRALWTGNNDLTEQEIADDIGVPAKACRMKAFYLGIKRHPDYVTRMRERMWERMRTDDYRSEFSKRAHADRVKAEWPPHCFEDDPTEHAKSIWRRGKGLQKFMPVRSDMNQTFGGVPSGWSDAVGIARSTYRAGAA